MNVKEKYFQMNKEEFKDYLSNLKSSNNCIHILDDKFFFIQTIESMNLMFLLNKKMNTLDQLINSFTDFSKKQIIQSFLIDEINSTNEIENVHSTKHDIYSIISDKAQSKNKKIVSISNAYKQLLETKGVEINNLEEIRDLYDIVLKNSIDKEDYPDGQYFRKGNVYVNDGIKNIHIGTSGEENINKDMNEFIYIYNSNNEIFTRLILSHFIFENVHPFYDGNGRLGRFLFSNKLYKETGSVFSFIISSAILNNKSEYYKAFKEAEDRYSFGCLNEYVDLFVDLLNIQMDLTINKLKDDINFIDKYKNKLDLTKSEEKIYNLLLEATIYSSFGVTNEEIIEYTGVSKRTLINSLNKFKTLKIIEDSKIGKFDFHKLSLHSIGNKK